MAHATRRYSRGGGVGSRRAQRERERCSRGGGSRHAHACAHTRTHTQNARARTRRRAHTHMGTGADAQVGAAAGDALRLGGRAHHLGYSMERSVAAAASLCSVAEAAHTASGQQRAKSEARRERLSVTLMPYPSQSRLSVTRIERGQAAMRPRRPLLMYGRWPPRESTEGRQRCDRPARC